MADIKPIRAWRYQEELSFKIDQLTSPLFDVVSEKQRNVLYQNPLNSIHLSVPQGSDPARKANRLLANWKKNHVIRQDKPPGIYVYYQYFKLAGSRKQFCRKGFICHIRTYDWNENVILRHENTIPKAVNDRVDLLRQTQLHSSATHGLYTDELHHLEPFMDEAIRNPIYETEDYQGVRDVLAVIHDAAVIRKFIDQLAGKKVILADGHHRYEGSLLYKHECIANNSNHTGAEPYNYHLMYLTNTESDDLRILPTHRLIRNIPDFDENKFVEKLADDFVVKEIEDADTLNEVIIGKQHAFGLLLRDRCYKLRLKEEKLRTMRWNFPEEVKRLDLTVMHYFIFEKVLGIPGKEQRQSEFISFDRSFTDCLAKVIKGDVQMAIITNELSIEDVKSVCHSGYTMPQKSTYFYPKVICGFLFSSIKDAEFYNPVYSPF